MLWVKAFHLIFMVAWFAGLFYLPRLFVYHVDAEDAAGIARFKIMERRLLNGIMWPAALMTTGFGILLMTWNLRYYLHASWMHAKLLLVGLLWVFHLSCAHFVRLFAQDHKQHSARFFRFYNELPTLLLMGIVILVVVKP